MLLLITESEAKKKYLTRKVETNKCAVLACKCAVLAYKCAARF